MFTLKNKLTWIIMGYNCFIFKKCVSKCYLRMFGDYMKDVISIESWIIVKTIFEIFYTMTCLVICLRQLNSFVKV